MTPAPRPAWDRLAAAARSAPDTRAAAAPPGFATRVAALALGRTPATVSLLDLLALRALGVALLLAACSVAVNYEEAARRLHSLGGDEAAPVGEDTVALVLALAD